MVENTLNEYAQNFVSAELAGNFVTAEVVENSLQQLNDNLTAEIEALSKEKPTVTDPAIEEMN